MDEKRKPGRPRKYEGRESGRGAPVLTVRLEPDVYEHIHAQPAGARSYLERLVRADRDKNGAEGGRTETEAPTCPPR